MAGGLRLGLWMKYLAGFRLAPYVPTPHHVGRAMLRLAGVKPSDFVVDLGCGDGRLLISAAKHYGARGYGVEMDSLLVKEAIKAIEEEGLGHMISVEQQDAMDADLREASVVALYLTDAGNAKILPKLRDQLQEKGKTFHNHLRQYAMVLFGSTLNFHGENKMIKKKKVFLMRRDFDDVWDAKWLLKKACKGLNWKRGKLRRLIKKLPSTERENLSHKPSKYKKSVWRNLVKKVNDEEVQPRSMSTPSIQERASRVMRGGDGASINDGVRESNDEDFEIDLVDDEDTGCHDDNGSDSDSDSGSGSGSDDDVEEDEDENVDID